MRLTTDLFAYCREKVPKWNTISISGYHMREKGCSAVQEVGFTLANAIAYVQAAIDAGLDVDEFGPRLAFFFNGHNNVFQEVAKFRAARRMWAEIMRERFGSENPKSQTMRFHTQTGGVTLAAQQPENNIVRVALQGFAAVCGGTQSLHTNGFDEALALPTERAARIALRTQQILAHESGATDTVDPFAGSYFVENLTDQIEVGAQGLIDKVDELGGSVQCIPFIRAEVEESAWGYEERYRQKQDIVVGVNEYVTDTVDEVEILRVDPESEREQVERLKKFKADRDGDAGAEAPRGAARRGEGRGQPARADPRGAEGPRLARRGVRRDARGVRRVLGGLMDAAEHGRTACRAARCGRSRACRGRAQRALAGGGTVGARRARARPRGAAGDRARQARRQAGHRGAAGGPGARRRPCGARWPRAARWSRSRGARTSSCRARRARWRRASTARRADERAGLLVYFHGGGHVIGDLTTCESVCRFLSRHAGVNVLAVDYRLAPEHPVPRRRGRRHGVTALGGRARPRRWAPTPAGSRSGGDSAGGNIATVAALDTATGEGPVPDFQLLIYPGLRLLLQAAVLHRVRSGVPAHQGRDGLVPRPLPARGADALGPARVAAAGRGPVGPAARLRGHRRLRPAARRGRGVRARDGRRRRAGGAAPPRRAGAQLRQLDRAWAAARATRCSRPPARCASGWPAENGRAVRFARKESAASVRK